VFGFGYFGKGYFGGSYFGPPPFGGKSEPWGAIPEPAAKSATSTIFENLSDETISAINKKLEIFETVIKSPKTHVKPSIDSQISSGLMREQMEIPPVLSPDIALMIAIAEACD
jgi:hypothetical protein